MSFKFEERLSAIDAQQLAYVMQQMYGPCLSPDAHGLRLDEQAAMELAAGHIALAAGLDSDELLDLNKQANEVFERADSEYYTRLAEAPGESSEVADELFDQAQAAMEATGRTIEAVPFVDPAKAAHLYGMVLENPEEYYEAMEGVFRGLIHLSPIDHELAAPLWDRAATYVEVTKDQDASDMLDRASDELLRNFLQSY